jgi:putative colanic acid biosynthesis acetyltransferase WcaF
MKPTPRDGGGRGTAACVPPPILPDKSQGARPARRATMPVNSMTMKLANSADPFLRPAFSLRNRCARLAWNIVQSTVFRLSPRPLHQWRVWLLRCFGAQMGRHCHVYPRARIWAPWNIVCEEAACIGDEAIIYNPDRVVLRSHAIVSQQAYLCGATHDYRDPTFPMTWAPIVIGRYAWVCARATVLCGVTVGDGAILGLGSVTSRDLDAWGIYAGIPARKINTRPQMYVLRPEPAPLQRGHSLAQRQPAKSEERTRSIADGM